jgi:hypothetical protein
MNVKQKTNTLPWTLIVSLGLFALIRPIVKMLGDVFGYEVSSLATMAITVVIALVWVVMVIKLKVKKPVHVLALSGIVYAVSSILIAATIQLLAPDLGNDEAKISTLLTVGLVATTAFNFVYGAFLGFVAMTLQKVVNS